MGSADTLACTHGWEALRSDVLPWLLDESRPNLHWRVLVDLVGRPPDSPAVRRARGGANACEPVASLLKGLESNGGWATETPFWHEHEGPGWRLIAAVQWGADPEDPRLHAAAQRLLATAPGDGGLETVPGAGPDGLATARALEAVVKLGWAKHPRVQEWFAWFEATLPWREDPSAVVAVLAAAGTAGRSDIADTAATAIKRRLAACRGNNLTTLGHPNFHRTDLAEIFAVSARAGVEFDGGWHDVLARLQSAQDSNGRWDRISSSPAALGLPSNHEPSRWITLRATLALLTYAVDAGLPRLFPQPPG